MDLNMFPNNTTPYDSNKLRTDKVEFLVLVMSNTIYMFFIMRSLACLKSTKDKKFLFLVIASTCAFINNTNDIYYRISAPFFFKNACVTTFILFFKISGLANWIPISFYQIVRLYQITINYYKKSYHRGIILVSVILSSLYSIAYLCNLSQFSGTYVKFRGCVVNNTNRFSHYVEITDILDSSFSLIVVIFTLFISLKNLKQYKLRHHRIKAVLDETNSNKPGGDIYWDGLSVIVFYCTYRLLNIKPRLNEKLENNQFNPISINNHRKLSLKEENNMYSKSKSNSQVSVKMYNRNSKGELEFPSFVKKKDIININSNNYRYNNIFGQFSKNNEDLKMNQDIINNGSTDNIIKNVNFNINNNGISSFNCTSSSCYHDVGTSSYNARYSNSNLKNSNSFNDKYMMSSYSILKFHNNNNNYNNNNINEDNINYEKH
ncbi:hypothetical protein U3516DRAFT_834553 [Neocallimastix sp. 'constans']